VTSIQHPISPSEIAQMFPSTPVQGILMPQMEQTDTVEELCAYHSYLDKLNDMFSPDPHIQHWTSDTILSHHVQHIHEDEKRRIYMKVQWPDDDSPIQNILLDDLRMDDPWTCVRYAYQNNLVYKFWLGMDTEIPLQLWYIHIGHLSSAERNMNLEWKFQRPKSSKNT
jgi:hypothetical protein